MSDERSEDENSAAETEKAALLLTKEELGKVRDALSARFGLRLSPGETMAVNAERSKEHCWVRVEISATDESFQLEVECAALPDDVPTELQWDPRTAFDHALDMVDEQLLEYFEEERTPRFHEDWRPYTFESSQLRFRGRESRPSVDALADQWLAASGDPENGEPN